MRAICPDCRQPNGVCCPSCGNRAAISEPATPKKIRAEYIYNRAGLGLTESAQREEPAKDALYVCSRETCQRHTRPFHESEGGITHRRHHPHGRCPPTQQQIQDAADASELTVPEYNAMSEEDRANAVAEEDRANATKQIVEIIDKILKLLCEIEINDEPKGGES